MSINPQRPNPTLPSRPPQPAQPKFVVGEGETPLEVPKTHETPTVQDPLAALLKQNTDILKQKIEQFKLHADLYQSLAKEILGESPSDANAQSPPATGGVTAPAAPASVGEVGALSEEQAVAKPQAEANSPAPQPASKYTPFSERTRLKVGWDTTKEYLGSNQVWWDMGISAVVGAIFAIGSPVMAVTIPTTMMVIGGIRLALLAAKMVQDPKGKSIDKMYKKWIKEDEKKAKKEAERSA
ncbi:hypothetical protein [Vampirovibrio sp.]|uniref:hypothetical protein n=1 Tax=Vampirovibrio sp. TaxID=2717857 RepID=UPI0035935D03